MFHFLFLIFLFFWTKLNYISDRANFFGKKIIGICDRPNNKLEIFPSPFPYSPTPLPPCTQIKIPYIVVHMYLVAMQTGHLARDAVV